MKLRQRLAFVFTALNALALLVSFGVVLVLVERNEVRELDEALVAQANATGHALRLARSRPLPGGTTDVTESFTVLPRYIALYADDGRLVRGNLSFGDGAPHALGELGVEASQVSANGTFVDLNVRGRKLRGVLVPLGQGESLLYAVSRRFIDEDQSFLFRICSALALIATVVTWLASRWVAAVVSRDVAAIGDVARAVAQGNLAARVKPARLGSLETRNLAADLDHMIEQLNGLVSAQRTFIAHAAHELRSPLTALRGELQLALRRPREAAGYRSAIESSLAEVELLTALTEDLLLLARMQGATQPELFASVPALEVVDEGLRMARGQADARGVSVVLEEPSAAARAALVRAARLDLARAVRNLVDNAAAHGPANGRVQVALEVRGAAIAILVEDEGPGIPAEAATRIFSPFWRGAKQQAGDEGGTGLGLAIVREIARVHGGDVTLEPAPRTRFVLTIPLAEEPPLATEVKEG